MPAYTQPAIEPNPVLPVEPSGEEPPRRRAGAWLAAVAAVFALAWVLISLVPKKTAPANPIGGKTATVARGRLEVRNRIAGSTAAKNFVNIVAPRLRSPESDRDMPLVELAASGAVVKKGQIVAQFDTQAIRDHLDDTIANFRNTENTVQKLEVQLELEMSVLQQTLAKAKAALDKARLDLKTAEVRSAIKTETMRLAVEEADAVYQALLGQLPDKKASQQAELQAAKIGRTMDEMHVGRHEEDLQRLTVKAPSGGLAVVQPVRRPGGDQAVFAVGDRVTPGMLFLRIVDPSEMLLEGTVNQAEIGLLRVGQEAVVRLDAYPGASYKGRVDSIGAFATTPGRQQFFLRTVPIRVRILDADERVIPDLSASADILLRRDEGVLLAPPGAIQQEDGKTYVYVRSGESFVKRPVTVGDSQGAQAEILSGIAEGDVVAIN